MKYETLDNQALDLICPIRLGDDEMGELKELQLSGEDIPDDLLEAILDTEEGEQL